MDFEKDILKAEEKLISQYGFLKEEINFIVKKKPTFIILDSDIRNPGIQTLDHFFIKQKGYSIEVVRTLILRYPYILSKNLQTLEEFFVQLSKVGLSEKEIMKALVDCPKLISKNLQKQMKEIFFLFNLYHGINQDQVIDIFRKFPYLFCIEPDRIQEYLAQFKKYRFQKDSIIRVCKESGGILACRVSTIKNLFDYFKKEHKIKAADIVEIIDHYPEFVMQGRREIIKTKINLIKKESSKNDIYLRNLIKRHPDILMKSLASMEAKIQYVTKTLGKNLQKEKTFPLLLHYNYHGVIKSRCEVLKQTMRHFDLAEVLPLSDDDFCKKFEIEKAELDKKKSEREIREEKDILWSYVPGL